MKYLNKYNSFGINESDEIKDSDNPKRSERLLTQAQKEHKDTEDPNTTKCPLPAMLFTDVVGSSKLWSDDPITMSKQLDEHHELIDSLSTKNNGWIVKTIGDAFMIYFEPSENSLTNALKCAKDILLNESKYNLRIGVAQGPMDSKTYTIQKVNLKDFFGNAVNLASRMESKVSNPGGGGIAFSSSLPISQNLLSEYGKIIGEVEDVDLSKFDLRGANTKSAYTIKIK